MSASLRVDDRYGIRSRVARWAKLVGLIFLGAIGSGAAVGCGSEASRCGDGVCQDDESPATCAADCRVQACGNGVCEPDESGLLCPVDCSCGNGTCDSDENALLCPADCQQASCGNTACEPGENMNDCPSDCVTPECENGACEPGENMNDCPADCTAPDCGNDACEPGEDTYSCGADCASTCGNSILEAGEACDSSVAPGQTCDSIAGHSEGLLGCTNGCQFDTSHCSTCGDNVKEGDEQCDNADFDGQDCADFGFSGGVLACDGLCHRDTTACNVCGDNVIQAPEVCDGTDLGTPAATCQSAGHSGGTIACASGCLQLDTSGCFDCGNGACEDAKGEDAVSCPQDCGWTWVSAGAYFTCGIRVNGTAWCWGRGDSCQLGDGGCVDRLSPAQLPGLSGSDAITAGHGLHACALRNGSVYCWGYNGYGQLGQGTTVDRSTPALVPTPTDAIDVAAGGRHTCVVRSNDETWCFGAEEWGLGTQWPPDTCSPWGTAVGCSMSPMEVLNNSTALTIDAGWENVCSLHVWNAARCWGGPWVWDEGIHRFDTSPGTVTGADNGVEIAVSNVHACLVNANGTLRCWGTNDAGQIGPNATPFGSRDGVWVPGITGAELIAAGGYYDFTSYLGFTCVTLASDGSLRCWGDNTYGQLGDNTTTSASSATPVTPVGLANVVQIDAGLSHMCALTSDNRLYCWGRNYFGEVGDGTTTQRTAPVPVP